MSARCFVRHNAVITYLLDHPLATAEEVAVVFFCTAERIRQIARLYGVSKGWMRKQ
jgi:hypothetical protein